MDKGKVIIEIEDALSGNLAKVGHVYRMSLNGLKDKALKDALELLNEQEQTINELEYELAVTKDNLNFYLNGNS